MRVYKYEMHAHTTEVSICASITGAELVQFYKDRGYSGVCVTDHFLNGNTKVPRHLSWEDRVNMFCSGYENALAHGQKIGIDVFFGWEYSYKGADLLTYGLDKAWLLSRPDLLEYSVNEYLDLVRREGGMVVHAHPFREADYLNMIRLFPRQTDGMEILNANSIDFENQRAKEFAEHYNLLPLAGSDNHHGWQKRLCGVRFNRPLENIGDMIFALKSKESEIFAEYPTR